MDQSTFAKIQNISGPTGTPAIEELHLVAPNTVLAVRVPAACVVPDISIATKSAANFNFNFNFNLHHTLVS